MRILLARAFALLLLCAAAALHAQDLPIYDDALENGWTIGGSAVISPTNTSPVHSGSDSISVVDPVTGYSQSSIIFNHSTLNSSLYQSLSFWIYPTSAGNNQLKVYYYNTSGIAQPPVYLSFPSGQVNQWQQETIPLSSLGINGTDFAALAIQNNTGQPRTWYLDDISLVAYPAPGQVALTADAQNVVRTIDSRFYGLNVTVYDSYLNTGATGTILTAMGKNAVRFPGGSQSDHYDWSTGKNLLNGIQEVNNAPTFANITTAAGAQAYVTVNYGSGTPEQAAAWVAYYNGNASSTQALGTDSMGRNWQTVGYWATIRGSAPLGTDDGYNFLRASHPAPYGFKYWEIGNECYNTNEETDKHGVSGSGLSGVQWDPYTYAYAFQTFYNEMRAVDATIHIGAVASTNEDGYGNGTHAVLNPREGTSHSGWTPVVLWYLTSLGVTPDFLIYHFYSQSPGGEFDSILLGGGASLQGKAANLRQMINDYMGASQGSSIELAVTEMNSVGTAPGKQSTSLVNGLFCADALGQLAQTEFNACLWWQLRNGTLTNDNNSAALYGWRLYGDYGVVAYGNNGSSPVNTPYPPYYAAQLMTYWGRGGDLVVNATSSYPLLSIYAAKLANGNLALLVINKHPTTDLPAQITLSNVTSANVSVPVYSYGKPNDNASQANDVPNEGITTGAATLSGTTINYTFPSYSMSVLVVDTTPPTLSPVSIASGNAKPSWAKLGDTVTVSFTASEPIQTPSVTLLGVAATVANPSGNTWTATATVVPGTTQGAATFSITAIDLAGNTATAVTGTTDSSAVTVDTTAPVLSLPASFSAEATSAAGRTVTYTASASDALDPAPSFSAAPASGTVFPLGTTTVNASATDAAGNTATGSFTVTVRDTTPPVVTPPANVTVPATSPSGAVVTYSAATATDAVTANPVITYSQNSGTVFPIGTTTVNVSAHDAAGNIGTGSFTVTVTPLTAAQSWRYQYFGVSANSGNAADTAEPYGNGIPNLAVLAFLGPNQNPATVQARQLPQPQRSGGNFFYSFTQPAGVSGITYGAQYTTSPLGSPNWQAITDTGSGSTHIFSIPISGNQRAYMRLTVAEQ